MKLVSFSKAVEPNRSPGALVSCIEFPTESVNVRVRLRHDVRPQYIRILCSEHSPGASLSSSQPFNRLTKKTADIRIRDTSQWPFQFGRRPATIRREGKEIRIDLDQSEP